MTADSRCVFLPYPTCPDPTNSNFPDPNMFSYTNLRADSHKSLSPLFIFPSFPPFLSPRLLEDFLAKLL